MWWQSQLSGKHMEVVVLSERHYWQWLVWWYYISSRKLEPKLFSLGCWNQFFCVCLSCSASFQPVYPEINVGFCGPHAICFNRSLKFIEHIFNMLNNNILTKSSSVAVKVWVLFKLEMWYLSSSYWYLLENSVSGYWKQDWYMWLIPVLSRQKMHENSQGWVRKGIHPHIHPAYQFTGCSSQILKWMCRTVKLSHYLKILILYLNVMIHFLFVQILEESIM